MNIMPLSISKKEICVICHQPFDTDLDDYVLFVVPRVKGVSPLHWECAVNAMTETSFKAMENVLTGARK